MKFKMVNTAMPLRGLQVLAMLSSLLVMGCSAEAPPLTQQTVYPVKLMTLEQAQSGTLKQYPGSVSASDHSELSFRVGGELTELAVKAGDTVEKGEVVARLDDRDARTRLENARSNFNLAQATFERMRISLERQAISQARFDEAEAEYLSARAQLASAEDQLSYTVLKAPFDGVISRVPVDAFQVVSAQQAIAELQRPGSIDVSFQMPEQQVRRLQPQRSRNVRANGNTIAWVQFPELPDKRYAASYKEHDSNASQGSLSYEVTVTLPEPEDITVLSGMSATVLLDYGTLAGESAPSWLIPTAALVTPDAEPDTSVVWRYVAAADDGNGDNTGRVEPVDVEPGKKMNDGVLVRGELSPGDRIVVAGAHRMNRDRSVRPWEKEGGL
ncbi:efflux RND transporter periplasmic adaptor subunit [Marinobacter salsuginis]|uniref:efflux RND transporter periplasmic adaptor subunit n=1 Tax=Marinobacter salsuginis TaxID=418719 RepID=UPI001ADF89A9|nr:efflux RND transporter periplasmic adaptor subunit [Marinobacter salsuginis]QTN40769.1 efflux RND transporter periplasmic adaptor subunit [Marinobacter salsuginis]